MKKKRINHFSAFKMRRKLNRCCRNATGVFGFIFAGCLFYLISQQPQPVSTEGFDQSLKESQKSSEQSEPSLKNDNIHLQVQPQLQAQPPGKPQSEMSKMSKITIKFHIFSVLKQKILTLNSTVVRFAPVKMCKLLKALADRMVTKTLE